MATPTLIAAYFVKSTAQGTAPLTTPSFTPSTGEVIIVKLETWDTANPMGAPSGGSQTYASRVTVAPGGFRPWVGIYTTVIAGSPGSMTISATPTASSRYSMLVERWSNAQIAATPATGSNNGPNGVASGSITTAAAGSVISWVSSDAQSVDPATRAYLGSGTDEGVRDDHVGVDGVGYHGRQAAPSAGTQSFGLSAPAGQYFSIAGIEVQGSASALSITATGVASSSAAGAPAVAPGAVTVTATGVTSSSAAGQPAVAPGAVTVSAIGVAAVGTVGQPAVSLTIAAAGVAPSSAAGQPAIVPGPVTITATTVPSVSVAGQPAVSPGAVTVTAAGVASTSAAGQPAVTPGPVTIDLVGVGTASVVAQPAVSQTIAAAGVASSSTAGQPVVAAGPVDVHPDGVPSASTVGAATVFAGQLVVLDGVASGSVFGELTVLTGPVTVGLLGVGSGGAVGAPSVVVEQLVAGAGGVPSISVVGEPAVDTGAGGVDVTVALIGVVSASIVGAPRVFDPDFIFVGERLFPNVQSLLVEEIPNFPGVHAAGVETPADLAEQLPFVRITGGGGPADQVNAFSVINIDVFGAEYHATNLLARRLQNWLMGPPPPIWQLDRAVCDSGPQELPWADDTGPHRFGLTFRFTARRHLEQV